LPIPDKGACSVLQPRGDALILIKWYVNTEWFKSMFPASGVLMEMHHVIFLDVITAPLQPPALN
jgi:hypothetical protein